MAGKILIVDDEPDIIMILKVRLAAEGYQVVTAGDGNEALEKFKSEKPDLVITDVMMPGMSGYEFFEALRGIGGAAATVPVIVISAKGSMGQFFDKWAIRKFMHKPLDIPEFLREIKGALETGAVPEKNPSRKPGEAGKVLLAGVSEYEMRNMSECLTSRGFEVLRALDEKDAVKTAREEGPEIIFIEFWEDAARFDALGLYKNLCATPDTSRIPCMVFCNASLQIDASKNFPAKNILSFSSVKDLLQKIESLLQLPEFQRSRA